MAPASLFLAYLAQFDDQAWHRVVDRLDAAIHPVDRTATRIWFHFFPLRLQQALDAAADPQALARRLLLRGRWRLSEQIDTAHTFLYGHRYWGEVRNAVVRFAEGPDVPGSLDPGALVQQIAHSVAADAHVDVSWLVGITAVAVRTLQQTGLDAFRSTPARPAVRESWARLKPDQVLARRAKDDAQGLLGFLRGDRKIWTVTFDEQDPEARFPLVHSQHITTAAACDPRDHRGRDERLTEGAIPVQCRSASCGSCRIGVLGGADKLSPVEPRERAVLSECGYASSAEERPVIRLACQAQAFGAVSIVVPPWNGHLAALPPA